MKSKLLFLIFILAAIGWALIVTVTAAQHGFAVLRYGLECPWAGIALGTLGGFMIAALGLRMYAHTSTDEAIRKISRKPQPVPPAIFDAESCRQQSYIDHRKARVR